MKFDQMILGQNQIVTTDSRATGLNNNVFVCGASGSGKTLSYVEPRLLEAYESTLIVLNAEESLIDEYTPLLKKRGYKVNVIDFAETKKTNIGLCLLGDCRNREDIAELAEDIVMCNRQEEYSYAETSLDEASVMLLRALIELENSDELPSFNGVLYNVGELRRQYHEQPVMTNIDKEFGAFEKTHPGNYSVDIWKAFTRVNINDARRILSHLDSKLKRVFSFAVLDVEHSWNCLDIRKLAEEKTVLFIRTSLVNNQANNFLNIFYAQLFRKFFQLAKKEPGIWFKRPIHIIWDNFAATGVIKNFPEYIRILKEQNIAVSIILQSESQLHAMYKEWDTTIINNCDTYLFFGSDDLKTAENISKRLDWPLSDVLYMPLNQMAVFRRGTRPVVTERYNTFEHERYDEMEELYQEEQDKIKEWFFEVEKKFADIDSKNNSRDDNSQDDESDSLLTAPPDPWIMKVPDTNDPMWAVLSADIPNSEPEPISTSDSV